MAWNWRRGTAPAGPAKLSPKPAQKLESKAALNEGFVALHLSGTARWTPRDYASLARQGYLGNAVVHAAVRLIAQTAASVPWLLYEGATEHADHPLLSLMDRPNSRQAGVSFLEALYGQLLLSGNAYLERLPGTSDVAELHLLRPDRTVVIADDNGWPIALEYRTGKGGPRRIALTEDAGPEGGSAALHLALFHPLDDHYGLAPLQAALSALDIHNAASLWNKALLDNAARPSGALVYAPKEGGNLSEEQFDRVEIAAAGGLRALKPLAPVHAKVQRVGEIYRFRWIRRGRSDADRWDGTDIPLGEEDEAYEAAILSQSGSLILSATLGESLWDVPASLFASAPASACELRIAQFSRVIGSGVPMRRTFVPNAVSSVQERRLQQ